MGHLLLWLRTVKVYGFFIAISLWLQASDVFMSPCIVSGVDDK